MDIFWTFYLNHLSPLWGYFSCKNTERYAIWLKNFAIFQYIVRNTIGNVNAVNGTLFDQKISVFSQFVKTDNFSWRYIKRYCITVEILIFGMKLLSFLEKLEKSVLWHWTVWHLTRKTSFWWYFSQIHQTVASYLLKKVILWKSIIFQWNTLNGTAFALKSWYFY